jgi:hypothetical protein
LVDAAQAQADEPVTTRLIADEIELWDWFDPGYRRNVTEGAAPKLEHPRSTLVLLDGIEGMMSNLHPDARDEMSERLMRALRTPDSRTPTVAAANLHVTRFVIACDAGGVWSTRLSALCAQRLDFETDGPPGRARFGGAMMQVPFVEQATCPDATVTPQSIAEVPLNETLVVVDGEIFGQTPQGRNGQRPGGSSGSGIGSNSSASISGASSSNSSSFVCSNCSGGGTQRSSRGGTASSSSTSR